MRWKEQRWLIYLLLKIENRWSRSLIKSLSLFLVWRSRRPSKRKQIEENILSRSYKWRVYSTFQENKSKATYLIFTILMIIWGVLRSMKEWMCLLQLQRQLQNNLILQMWNVLVVQTIVQVQNKSSSQGR